MINAVELQKVDSFFEAVFQGEIEKKDWILYFEDILGIAIDEDDKCNEDGGPFYEGMVEYFSEVFDSERPLPEKYRSELKNATKGRWYVGVVNFGSKEAHEKLRKSYGYSIDEYGTYEQKNTESQKFHEKIICACNTYGELAEALTDLSPQREPLWEEDDEHITENASLEDTVNTTQEQVNKAISWKKEDKFASISI